MTPYYDQDGITLYHGDCREVLPSLARVDAIVSDPPFGMNWDTDSTRFTGGKGYHVKRSKPIANDSEPFDPAPLLDFPKVALWGSNHFAGRLPVGTTLVWAKKSEDKFGKFLSDAEVGWMKGGHGVYLFPLVWDGCARESENGEHYHPTQKPVALMNWIMERMCLAPDAVVLDPYMGSGSTLVAAKLCGRRAIGIELEERYCAIAAKRLAQGVLFGASA